MLAYEQTLEDFCMRVLAYTFLEFMQADCVRRDGFYGSTTPNIAIILYVCRFYRTAPHASRHETHISSAPT